jgi:hypothetical protein
LSGHHQRFLVGQDCLLARAAASVAATSRADDGRHHGVTFGQDRNGLERILPADFAATPG